MTMNNRLREPEGDRMWNAVVNKIAKHESAERDKISLPRIRFAKFCGE